MIQNRSKSVLLLFCIVVFLLSAYKSTRKKDEWSYSHMIAWDSEGYYLYLPAVLINHSFENLDVRTSDSGSFYTYKCYPNTHKIFTKYTCGVAVMEAPFFIAARIIYKINNKDEPGFYAPIYMKALGYADAFYLAMGLYILGLYLLRYFSIWITILTSLIIWLGTNLLFYTSFLVGYSHVCSFFLISCLVYITPLLYSKPKNKLIILTAFILGLISLIRPTDIVVGLYIVCYEIYTWQQLRARLVLYFRNWYRFIIFFFVGMIVWSPQFLYWHYLSGNWLLYSYQNEHFIYWSNPKIFSVLFHPQNGFFLFAPMMLLSLIGMIISIKRKIYSGLGIFLIFIITDYICGSWWFWNFGSAYGFRPYIDFLGILAIPLSYFLSIAMCWGKIYRNLTLLAIVFLLFLSIRLQRIYEYPWQGPNWGWSDIVRIHRQALYIK